MASGFINELAGEVVCREEAITQALCTNILFLLCGYNEAQLNKVTSFIYFYVLVIKIKYNI